MNEPYIQIIRSHSRQLDPLPTDAPADLHQLRGIKSVLFDIYGTLLISASGDIGTTICSSNEEAFEQALAQAGLRPTGEGSSSETPSDTPAGTSSNSDSHTGLGLVGFQQFQRCIQQQHQSRREEGIEYPEVDIVEVWESTVETLFETGHVEKSDTPIDFRRLAIEYEVRTNPVWVMPGLSSCLDQLKQRGIVLGIISNAQFMTPLLFPALTKRTLEDFGFHRDVQFFSYQSRQAKPGRWLFEQARRSVESLSIGADEVLYVGNDLLNDITPAAGEGFRTALFAGDRRSLRMRQGDSRVDGIHPDLVVKRLEQILDCVC